MNNDIFAAVAHHHEEASLPLLQTVAYQRRNPLVSAPVSTPGLLPSRGAAEESFLRATGERPTLVCATSSPRPLFSCVGGRGKGRRCRFAERAPVVWMAAGPMVVVLVARLKKRGVGESEERRSRRLGQSAKASRRRRLGHSVKVSRRRRLEQCMEASRRRCPHASNKCDAKQVPIDCQILKKKKTKKKGGRMAPLWAVSPQHQPQAQAPASTEEILRHRAGEKNRRQSG